MAQELEAEGGVAKRVRVAQIGVGGMGRAHVEAVRASRRADLVAVCDVSEAALAAVQASGAVPTFSDYRTMFDAVPFDALICVLPHDAYPEVIELAAARGVHVLKEKPFARNLTDALRMHAAIERSGIAFLCGAQRQYSLPFVRAGEMMAAGELGDVFLAQGQILYRWRLDSAEWGWRGELDRSGGIAIVDSGWHILDALVWLKGMPSSVYARVGRMPAAAGDYEVDDKAILCVDFPDGAIGVVTACYLTLPNRFELLLCGTTAALELTQTRLTLHPRDGSAAVAIEDPGGNPIAAQFEHFLDVILNGVKPRVGAAEALAIQRVVQAAYESAATDRRVELA